jgi:hypothetical protein
MGRVIVRNDVDLQHMPPAAQFAWFRYEGDDPKPFIWTKSAEEILESIGRLLRRIKDPGH